MSDERAARKREQQRAASERYRAKDPERYAAVRQGWLERNREKVAAQTKVRVAAAPDRYRRYQRKHKLAKYGLTLDDYDRMVTEQNGVCVICRQPEPAGLALHVDHDHPTGVVRGLLCGGCNRALGLMRDDPRLFDRAAQYLRERGAFIHNEWEPL